MIKYKALQYSLINMCDNMSRAHGMCCAAAAVASQNPSQQHMTD